MAAKKEDDLVLLSKIVAVIVSTFFMLFAFYIYYKYEKRYNIRNADIRVYDSKQFMAYIVKVGGCGIIFLLCLFSIAGAIIKNELTFAYLYIIPIIIISFIGAFSLAGKIAVTYIGVLIYKNKNLIVIPGDTHNNSIIENIFKLKYMFDAASMEELPISGVQKITRESGKKVFIHRDGCLRI